MGWELRGRGGVGMGMRCGAIVVILGERDYDGVRWCSC